MVTKIGARYVCKQMDAVLHCRSSQYFVLFQSRRRWISYRDIGGYRCESSVARPPDVVSSVELFGFNASIGGLVDGLLVDRSAVLWWTSPGRSPSWDNAWIVRSFLCRLEM